MARQQVQLEWPSGPATGGTNSVQRVVRVLIWFGLFIILGGLTVVVGLLLAAVHGLLGVTAFTVGGLLSLIVPGMIAGSLYVVPEYQRLVVLKLGKFAGVRGPGWMWVLPYPPFYESAAAEIDTRVRTRVITAAQTLTADNVPVGVEAVIFWRVENPKTAALEVANYAEAVFQAANSALKDTIGTMELTDLLGERERISQKLKAIIDQAAATFGVDVSAVEITDIHVPSDLIQELSVLAQSRRAAQAKIAEAEAEKSVAERFQEAALLMDNRALELYRLNVLERIGREEGSQIVVYGMGSGNTEMGTTIASTAAGALSAQTRPDSGKTVPPPKSLE
jgi:regulator of protease activity HflC (stomatin/prohibitin superfamily)